ncbi:MAG: hypothetical protein ACREJP_04390 [Candidatus Methylomirabilales bacterium]
MLISEVLKELGGLGLTEVKNAQRGLFNRIRFLRRRLGHPGLTEAERKLTALELGEASRLLKYSRSYVP